MVAIVRLIFSCIWLFAFIITCIVMGFFLPFMLIFDGVQKMAGDGSVS